jgi:hypothetical protein
LVKGRWKEPRRVGGKRVGSSVVAAACVPRSGFRLLVSNPWSLVFFAPYRRFVVIFFSLHPLLFLSIPLFAKSKRRRDPSSSPSSDSFSTCHSCILRLGQAVRIISGQNMLFLTKQRTDPQPASHDGFPAAQLLLLGMLSHGPPSGNVNADSSTT